MWAVRPLLCVVAALPIAAVLYAVLPEGEVSSWIERGVFVLALLVGLVWERKALGPD